MISLIHSEIYRHENSSARNVQLDIRVNKTLENTEKLKNSMIDKDFNNRKKTATKTKILPNARKIIQYFFN